MTDVHFLGVVFILLTRSGARRSLATNRRRSGGYPADIHRKDLWFSGPDIRRISSGWRNVIWTAPVFNYLVFGCTFLLPAQIPPIVSGIWRKRKRNWTEEEENLDETGSFWEKIFLLEIGFSTLTYWIRYWPVCLCCLIDELELGGGWVDGVSIITRENILCLVLPKTQKCLLTFI